MNAEEPKMERSGHKLVYTPAPKMAHPKRNGAPQNKKPALPFWNLQAKLRQKPKTPDETALFALGMVPVGIVPVQGNPGLREGIVALPGFLVQGKNPYALIWDEHGNKYSLSSFIETAQPQTVGVAILLGQPQARLTADVRLRHNPAQPGHLGRAAVDAVVKYRRSLQDKFFLSAPVIAQNENVMEVLQKSLYDLLSSLAPDLAKDPKKTFLSEAEKKAVTNWGGDVLLKALHLNRPPAGVYEKLAAARATAVTASAPEAVVDANLAGHPKPSM